MSPLTAVWAAAGGPPPIANAHWAQALVLFHGLCGMALVGACTHHVVVSLGYLRGSYRVRLARVYAAVTLAGWGATVVLGGLAYPAYRYFVRGLYFDWHEVWASNLFDIKENFAALGLPLAVVIFLWSRRLDPRGGEGGQARLLVGPYVVLVCVAAAIAWFVAVAGLVVTLQRGVPT